MKSVKLACITASLVIALCAARLVAQGAPSPPTYGVVDLGTLGGHFSIAFGINDKGFVDGFSTVSGDAVWHAFVWHEGTMLDLRTLGGPNSQAFFGPNERVQVAGLSEISVPDPNGEDFCDLGTHLICVPFLWQAGVMTPLDALGGNNGQADGINNRGEAAGWAETATADPDCPAPQVLRFKPVIWRRGQPQKLPTFLGDRNGVAFAINDRGQAVGASGPCAAFDSDYGAPLQPRHALMWNHGTAKNLGSLGGKLNNAAFTINDLGQVGGTSGLPGDTAHHAFLWQRGVMTDLSTLPGDVDSGVLGISRGRVVGISVGASENPRAFLWENGVMFDLNTLIATGPPLFLLQASAINSQGEIVGLAVQTTTGDVHGFLAIPIPAGEDIAHELDSRIDTTSRVALSENVRKLLQRQLGLGRLRSRLIAP